MSARILTFARYGDFYEAFDDDARDAAKALGITLTSRAGSPMVGVPVHCAQTYFDNLLDKGFKIIMEKRS